MIQIGQGKQSMTECAHSAAVLHKQWAKLEDDYHELAIAIDAAQAKRPT